MPEIRERKQNEKIKGSGGEKKGTHKKAVRRQMTVKLQKELLERKKKRDTGGDPDTTPETQAIEQVEETAYTTSDRIRAFSGDSVSKAITQHNEEQQKKTPHTESVPGMAPKMDAIPTPSPPPAQELMRQKAVGDIRTRHAETGREQPAPKTRQPADIIHERPQTVSTGEQSQVKSYAPKERAVQAVPGRVQTTAKPPAPRERPLQVVASKEQPIITPKTPEERMRQATIKDKQTQRAASRQKPVPPNDQEIPVPLYERGISPNILPENTEHTMTAPPVPQERMRQKAVADAQIRHSKTGRTMISPSPDQPQISAPTIEHKPLSPDGQSINPIKERPRPSQVLKEKPTGGAFIPKTRQSAAVSKTTVKPAATAMTGKRAAYPIEQAKRRVQRNAQRKLLQQSTRTTKAAVDLSRKTAAVATRVVSSMTSAITGLLGGTFLLPVVCIIIFAAAIIASPFGILFSNEPTENAVPLNVAVGNLNTELANYLESLQTGGYDSIDIQGHGPDWREVVAVFAVKTAGSVDGIDVAALTPDRVTMLQAVFWDMCNVTSEVETINHPDSDPADATDDSWTERILHITITAKTADDMQSEYAFTDDQKKALTELLAELAAMDILLTDLSVSEEQARDLLRNLPADLSPERRAVVETACRLVGKVNYFWGGKSRVIGWDSRWGTIQKVWAAGSSTTGTYRPFGLDCSGFVDWVFYNVSNGAYIIGHGGGAHSQHTYCTAISWAEAQPGDLVFYPGDTHVGIVGGWDESGNVLIIHCASRQNNVVITGKAGFATIGRPRYYS